jgi:cytochrome b subunit of formate dehydrogenase
VPEDEKARIDRELIELLNELRIVLPGVQVLFAFLLILPFSQGFAKVTQAQRAVYFGSFVCTALATALFIAPSTYHRLRFRQKDKERMLFTANKLAIAGTALLLVATAGVVYLITDLLYHLLAASLVTAAISGWFIWFWYGLPLSRRTIDDS